MSATIKKMFTEEQLNLIRDEANKLAKVLLEKDVSKIFKEDGGNANYVLNVSVFFVAGIISIISKKITVNPIYLSKLFMDQVEECIKTRNDPVKHILSLVH